MDEPIAIAKLRVTYDISDAERMEGRWAAAVRHIRANSKKTCDKRKIAFDHFEKLRRLLRHTGGKGSRMNLRGVVLRPI